MEPPLEEKEEEEEEEEEMEEEEETKMIERIGFLLPLFFLLPLIAK